MCSANCRPAAWLSCRGISQPCPSSSVTFRAPSRQRPSRLHAQHAAADADAARPGSQTPQDPAGILPRSQRPHALSLCPRQRRHERMRPGCQDQPVVRQFPAAAKHDRPVSRQDLACLRPAGKVGAVGLVPVRRMDRQGGLADLASQISRQVQTIVRRVGLFRDQCNASLWRRTVDGLDRRDPGNPRPEHNHMADARALPAVGRCSHRLEPAGRRPTDRALLGRRIAVVHVQADQAAPLLRRRCLCSRCNELLNVRLEVRPHRPADRALGRSIPVVDVPAHPAPPRLCRFARHRRYFTSTKRSLAVPHTGHWSGAAPSTVLPHTEHTKIRSAGMSLPAFTAPSALEYRS